MSKLEELLIDLEKTPLHNYKKIDTDFVDGKPCCWHCSNMFVCGGACGKNDCAEDQLRCHVTYLHVKCKAVCDLWKFTEEIDL